MTDGSDAAWILRSSRRPERVPACPGCRGPVALAATEMLVSTNRGYRFPRVLVQWCDACGQALDVALETYPPDCGCPAHVETDIADVGAVPCDQQLVTVVFESCARCGQVREVALNH